MFNMISSVLKLPRKYKRALVLFFDISAIILSIILAFSLRLGYFYLPINQPGLMGIILLSPLLAIPLFIHFKLYSQVVRFVGFESIWQMIKAISLYALIWGLIVFMTAMDGIPRSVIPINWLLAIASICGSRLLVRWLLTEITNRRNQVNKTNVLIYGAGSAGIQLSNALHGSVEYKPIAFIDDSIELQSQSINGLVVYSTSNLMN